MQKLGNIVIAKMIEKKCTSYEVDFVLYISRFQNDQGMVTGVYYKDVKEALGFSVQEFYNVKSSLIEKGLISSYKESYYDHNITILENDFSDPDNDIYKGYVNTNHDIFFNPGFYKMKANAKLFALDLMKITYTNKASYQIGTQKLYEKYMKLFGVTRRVVTNYLKELKSFFAIGQKEHKYFITPKKLMYRSRMRQSESENFNQNEVTVQCRRSKIKIDKKDQSVIDVARLMNQYRKTAKEAGLNIVHLVRQSIQSSLEAISENKKKLVRELRPKLVHIHLKKALGI